jgi:iron(III) transport system substrate-binding protein
MRLHRSRLTRAAALVAVIAAAAACGDDDGNSSEEFDASDAGVVIYSGRGEELIQPILDDFEDETGIDVAVRYGNSADLALLIEEEAAAGNTQADVFLSQSPGSTGFLEQNDRLGTIPEATLQLVPETVRDDGGKWIGFSGRQRVLVYDTETVPENELPDSVFDLTAPEWEGRIGVAPSNGSFQDFVTAMRATEGDDVTMQWLEDLAANDPLTYDGNSAIVAAVGRGEVPVGLVNHYYHYRAVAEDPSHSTANHQFAPGDPGAILIVTGAATLADSDRPRTAAALIDFLLSDSGQQYFAQETFEYPLAIGQQPAADVPPIEFSDVSGVDYEALGGDLSETRQMIADAGLEG